MDKIKKLKKWSTVIISMLLYVIFLNVDLNAQDTQTQPPVINIKGRVMEENGSPLPGAAVRIKGTTIGVTCNDDGDYVLNNVPTGSVLEFILVGFTTKEVKGDKPMINVTLFEAVAESLEDVTIVAFGTQKKESVISAIETVNVKDLVIPGQNLTAAFAGRIPGMISYQRSGEPGADNAEFFIRGIATFGYKVDPLILLDGFEATVDDLARLQTDDIEDFSILKDAMATAVYGARGANGIIMVNTKRGKEGTARVSARIDTHIATPTKMLELLGAVEYMRLYNQARMSRYPELGSFYSEQKIQATEQGLNPMIYPNINWYDALFNNGTVNTRSHVSISGGGKVASYYISGGYEHETGLLKVDKLNNFNNNIDINRFNIRTTFRVNLTNTTVLDAQMYGQFEKYNGPSISASDIFSQVMDANPVDFPPVYEPDPAHAHVKHILFGSTLLEGANTKRNPYADMVRGYSSREGNSLSVQASLDQKLDFITESLNFNLKASVNTSHTSTGTRVYTPFFYTLETYNVITGAYTLYNLNSDNRGVFLGDATVSNDVGSTKYNFEARLNWNRRFGKHGISLMTVGMLSENVIPAGGSIFVSLPERNLGNSGRASYEYDSRYFFEFSYGYNGSEKFTGDKRYGFFPSVGGGWIVSNEAFWERLKNVVSMLKLKFTWGLVGNDAIAGREGRFFFLSNITDGGGSYVWGQNFDNSYSGYSVNRYANNDITWETAKKYNWGLELSFLKNRSLNFNIDYYKDIREHIYEERANYPSTTGLEVKIFGNSGKVSSEGIDASIDLKHSFNPDLWVQGRANFTYAVNKVLERDEPNYSDEYLKQVGQSASQQWGYVAERLFVDAEEIANSPSQTSLTDGGVYQAGDIKYTDVNKDGVVNSNDRIPIGFPVPAMQYGFGISTGWKRFDFSFFFQGSEQVSFYINPEGIKPFVDRRNAPVIIARDSWTEDHPNVHAFWPRLSPDNVPNNLVKSTWWLRDGSFIRLKTIEFGCNLPGVHKIFLQGARLYLSVENVFYLSKFKYWDPEVGENGLSYPLNRRFNIGLSLNF
jgi:TonB-linked SusC/RagA family outer membrane protein